MPMELYLLTKTGIYITMIYIDIYMYHKYTEFIKFISHP